VLTGDGDGGLARKRRGWKEHLKTVLPVPVASPEVDGRRRPLRLRRRRRSGDDGDDDSGEDSTRGGVKKNQWSALSSTEGLDEAEEKWRWLVTERDQRRSSGGARGQRPLCLEWGC
jgi:hypothetical protein